MGVRGRGWVYSNVRRGRVARAWVGGGARVRALARACAGMGMGVRARACARKARAIRITPCRATGR